MATVSAMSLRLCIESPFCMKPCPNGVDGGRKHAEIHSFQGSWTRNINCEIFYDAPGARTHYEHTVGKKDRLRNRVGNKEYGLSLLEPDALQLQVHLFACHRIQCSKGLIHKQHRRV